MLLATSAGGSNGGYTIRAIFDDASNLTSGENVKVDGVNVGTVGSVTATPHARGGGRAEHHQPGLQELPHRRQLQIRPQALIGEKFVDCLPTQPRVEGTQPPPFLKVIPSGQEGAGQVLLPVPNTHSPIEPDLLGDITRLPERQRFTIILNEFGAGLAGRGSDLNEVIKPRQSGSAGTRKGVGDPRQREQGVDQSRRRRRQARSRRWRPTAGGSWASSTKATRLPRRPPTSAVRSVRTSPPSQPSSNSSDRRSNGCSASPNRRPRRWKSFGIAAPGINKLFENVGTVLDHPSKAFLKSIGKTGKTTASALKAVEPLLPLAKSLGKEAKPFATNFSGLLTSLRTTGGLERLLDFIYLGAGNVNGYDALGHFIACRNRGGHLSELRGRDDPRLLDRQIHPRQHRFRCFQHQGFYCEHQLDKPCDGAHAGGPERHDPGRRRSRATRVRSQAKQGAASTAVDGAILGVRLTPASPAGRRRGDWHHLLQPGLEESSEASGMLLNYLLGN